MMHCLVVVQFICVGYAQVEKSFDVVRISGDRLFKAEDRNLVVVVLCLCCSDPAPSIREIHPTHLKRSLKGPDALLETTLTEELSSCFMQARSGDSCSSLEERIVGAHRVLFRSHHTFHVIPERVLPKVFHRLGRWIGIHCTCKLCVLGFQLLEVLFREIQIRKGVGDLIFIQDLLAVRVANASKSRVHCKWVMTRRIDGIGNRRGWNGMLNGCWLGCS
mmetsp:Transcript_45207/g.113806  ORF Transcript_45207/g.113806 Transcript_45207/m.113806 type:complete len:219 (-) Transcript_45207:178-834(-)